MKAGFVDKCIKAITIPAILVTVFLILSILMNISFATERKSIAERDIYLDRCMEVSNNDLVRCLLLVYDLDIKKYNVMY